MDLKDLKSAWETYSSQEMNKHRLEKETIQEMLKTRTRSLVERINQNIRIGLTILLLFIGYVVADSMFLSAYFSKVIIHQVVEYPKWLEPIDFFTISLNSDFLISFEAASIKLELELFETKPDLIFILCHPYSCKKFNFISNIYFFFYFFSYNF